MTLNDTSTMSTVAQGGVAVTAIAFLHTALMRIIPYAIIAVPLLILDLIWGVRAARHRKEQVRFSRAFRRTMAKTFDYVAWLIIAASVGLAFEAKWLELVILGLVMGNELISIIGNYLETKGIEFSWVGFYRWLFKAGAEKVGVTMESAEAEEIIKPKRERDPKTGRFVKKS